MKKSSLALSAIGLASLSLLLVGCTEDQAPGGPTDKVAPVVTVTAGQNYFAFGDKITYTFTVAPPVGTFRFGKTLDETAPVTSIELNNIPNWNEYATVDSNDCKNISAGSNCTIVVSRSDTPAGVAGSRSYITSLTSLNAGFQVTSSVESVPLIPVNQDNMRIINSRLEDDAFLQANGAPAGTIFPNELLIYTGDNSNSQLPSFQINPTGAASTISWTQYGITNHVIPPISGCNFTPAIPTGTVTVTSGSNIFPPPPLGTPLPPYPGFCGIAFTSGTAPTNTNFNIKSSGANTSSGVTYNLRIAPGTMGAPPTVTLLP